MFKVSTDKTKKLLHVSYSRHAVPDDAKQVAEKIKALLPDLPAGFRLLTDLSGLDSMEIGCAPHLERMMDLCNQAGVATVVRVIPDPKKDIGLNIMSLFHYRRKIQIVTCDSLAEAMKILAG